MTGTKQNRYGGKGCEFHYLLQFDLVVGSAARFSRGKGLPGRSQERGNIIKEGVDQTDTSSRTVSSDPVIRLTVSVAS
jgi:hypothetical protein